MLRWPASFDLEGQKPPSVLFDRVDPAIRSPCEITDRPHAIERPGAGGNEGSVLPPVASDARRQLAGNDHATVVADRERDRTLRRVEPLDFVERRVEDDDGVSSTKDADQARRAWNAPDHVG